MVNVKVPRRAEDWVRVRLSLVMICGLEVVPSGAVMMTR